MSIVKWFGTYNDIKRQENYQEDQFKGNNWWYNKGNVETVPNNIGEYYNIFRLVHNWANKIINEFSRLLLFLPLLSFKLGMMCNSGENWKILRGV